MFRFVILQTNLITLRHIWSVKKVKWVFISSTDLGQRIPSKDLYQRMKMKNSIEDQLTFFSSHKCWTIKPLSHILTNFLPSVRYNQATLFVAMFCDFRSILHSYFCQILFYLLRITFGPLLKWYHIWEMLYKINMVIIHFYLFLCNIKYIKN